ncbi:MAG: hypothetical protein ACTSPM_11765 [Candidatus Heimdallarchaeota archaeon]
MKITNFAIIEIGREKGASALHVSGLSDKILKQLLIDALPQGNPESEFFKIVKIENDLFISSLLLADNEDYGLAMILKLDSTLQEVNPIGFIEGMNKLLKSFLTNSEDIPETLDLSYQKIALSDSTYENFDTIIFSILTQQKTLVVGEKEEITSFLANLFEFIPNSLKQYLTLIANSTNLSNNVAIHALVVTDDVLKIIDNKKGEYTILFLPTKTAYGSFSSPFCKKIAQLFEEQKKESIKEELIHFFKISIESEEIVPMADFAAEHHITLADASLLQRMRAGYFDLEVEKGFFEQTE